MRDGYIEYLNRAQVSARISDIGAEYLPDYSNAKQTTYWAESLKLYLRVILHRDGIYEVEYTKECDCNG
jgi:hypothetical protein